jgi:hypothetical protein
MPGDRGVLGDYYILMDVFLFYCVRGGRRGPRPRPFVFDGSDECRLSYPRPRATIITFQYFEVHCHVVERAGDKDAVVC